VTVIAAMLRDVRTSERLSAHVDAIATMTGQLQDIQARDPELGPELNAMAAALVDACSAAARAIRFIDARLAAS
jgi:hypothetical protein